MVDMKLEVGMYVRTDTGQIAKNHGEFYEPSVDIGVGIMEEVNGIWIDNKCIHYIDKKHITKASYDIIDLIQLGDYVNGEKVILTQKYSKQNKGKQGTCLIQTDVYDIYDNEQYLIKSIVTKEQFSQMEYRIGE